MLEKFAPGQKRDVSVIINFTYFWSNVSCSLHIYSNTPTPKTFEIRNMLQVHPESENRDRVRLTKKRKLQPSNQSKQKKPKRKRVSLNPLFSE